MPASAVDRRHIEERGIRAISFDVFDTCAVRRVGPPSELFRAVAQALAKSLHVEFSDAYAEAFVESRCEAERRAHRHATREQVTLEEIWLELTSLLGQEELKGINGPALELAEETLSLCPIACTRERIAEERAQGMQIIFISDTYHPGSFIEQWLRNNRFSSEADRVYVSAEAGRTKRTGTLFRHVLERERLSPAELLHVGNDPLADVEAPARLGIRTELFTRSRLESIERLLLKERPLKGQLWIRTSAELKRRRLARPRGNAAASAQEKFVEQFLGPFCCAFGHWVLNRAQADGAERLFFASRDARLLWPVCQSLARSRNLAVDQRYLMVSRQALRLPLISELRPTAMPWLRESRAPATLSRLLGNFELKYAEYADEWRRFRPDWKEDAALATSLEWALFWRFLNLPKIKDRILETAGARRSAAKEYLQAQGVFDPQKAAYVDLGWFLGCQRGINALRAEMGAPDRMRGYYLGLKRSRLGPAEAGPAMALFYESPDDTMAPPHQAWLRRCYLLEQIVGIADHASVHSYGNQRMVQFVSEPDPANLSRFQKIETALLDYTAAFGEGWKAMAEDESQLPAFLATLLRDFFDHPTPAAVETLREISFSFEQGAADSERLIASYSWPEALKACLSRASARRIKASRVWPEACLQATPESIRHVLRYTDGARRLGLDASPNASVAGT